MKLYIRGTWYDADYEILAAVLDNNDKKIINQMTRGDDIYYCGPLNTQPEQFGLFKERALRDLEAGKFGSIILPLDGGLV